MKSEMTSLEKSGTWYVCQLPQGKQPVGCKWIHTIKYNPNGNVERHVSCGGQGLYTTGRPGLSRHILTSSKDWYTSATQLDVSNTLLNGELDEEIYMKLPEGYEEITGKKVPLYSICRLHKSLYGLKQESRQCHKLSEVILGDGFKQTHSDHSLFI